MYNVIGKIYIFIKLDIKTYYNKIAKIDITFIPIVASRVKINFYIRPPPRYSEGEKSSEIEKAFTVNRTV